MTMANFMDLNKGTVWFTVATIGVCVLAMTIASCDKHNTRVYAQNGYEQVQKAGTTDTMWVKKRENK